MFNVFRTFMTVYETRSFSLAAKRLFISQPTISHHIADLERELGTILFIRKKRSATTPTPAADILYAFSGKLFADWERTSGTIHHLDENETLTLRIGMSQSISMVLFPKIAAALHKFYPHLHYDVNVTNSTTVIKQMEGHKIDLGFIEQPLTLTGTKRFTLCADQLVVAGEDTGTWIMREHGSGIGYYTYQYLRERNIEPRNTMQVNTTSMVLQLLQNGVGQALISNKLVPSGVPVQEMGSHFLRHFYLLRDEQSDWPHKRQITELISRTATG